MPLQLTVHHGLPYLLVEVAGPVQLADTLGLVDMVAAICAATPYRKCLIDLRAVQATLPFTEHLLLGTHAGEKFRTLEKIATVPTPQAQKGTAEKAAQKVGARLRTFTNMDEAVAWISS
jgi:hypothetical protein